MSPTYIANAVMVIMLIVNYFKIDVAPEAVQTTVSTLILVFVPLFTMFRQWYTGRSTLGGFRPK